MSGDNEGIQKDDLFLLLEGYKNSVETNTMIAQQLRIILEILQKCKEEDLIVEKALKEKIEAAIVAAEKAKEKIEENTIESIKGSGRIITAIGKLTTKVIILYFAIGGTMVSLLWIIYQLVDKFEVLHKIATKLGV